jgi:hypothetical protein
MAGCCDCENIVSVISKCLDIMCRFLFSSFIFLSRNLFPSLSHIVVLFLKPIRYCSFWDYRYDWGLLQPGHLLLRSNLKFSRAFYYWAIFSNFMLRCSWALAMSPNVSTNNDLALFVLQMAEIFRRMQWFIIRVEWESYAASSSSHPPRVALKTRYTVASPRSSQACLPAFAFLLF